jgi:DNA polymerase-3 subunit delta
MADLKPAYLITGTDRPKVTRAVRRLRDRIGEDASELLSAAEVGGADVVASCNALGLFVSERRLVVVEHVESWKAADIDPVLDYLKAPSPETVLAVVGELRKDSALGKAVAKSGELLVYDLPKRGTRADLPGWVGRQFVALGIKVDPAVSRLLVELVGDNLDELAGEVEKVAAWANGEPVGEREIELLVAPRGEIPPFAMTDAWGRRDVAAVLEASERLLARAGGPARDSLPRIVGLMTSHVARVAECRSLAADGVSPREAAERLKKNRFYVEKLFEQATNFTAEELRDAIVRLAELDLALKGGSRLAGELEFSRALVDLTRLREKVA